MPLRFPRRDDKIDEEKEARTLQHLRRSFAFRGLTAFQLKVIALVFMTIDHIGAYGYAIPLVKQYYMPLRTIGRMAAPIFLFLLVQSARHTRDRRKFLLRLYLAGLCTGLFTTFTNLFLGDLFGVHKQTNVIFTFFYTVLYIELLERFAAGDRRTSFLCFLLSLTPCVLPDFELQLLQDLKASFLPALPQVDYGWPMVLLGVLLYFAGTARRQCLVFTVFCCLCYLDFRLGWNGIPHFSGPLQWKMILALPLMLLYNGKRGRSGKYFFYFYYPLHRYLISVAAVLLT